MKYDIIIGIDPDVERDGVAILQTATRSISATMTTFGETLATLSRVNVRAISEGRTLLVAVEAGWLNRGNFHLTPYDTKRTAAAKGVAQGRNHQRGLDIIEYCRAQRINVEEFKPLAKAVGGVHIWNGQDGKITQKEAEAIMGKLPRLNQEGRDAALIAWVRGGMPFPAISKPAALRAKSNKTRNKMA